VLTHFGGEFSIGARWNGSIRGYERNDGLVGVDTHDYYRDFAAAMRDIGYKAISAMSCAISFLRQMARRWASNTRTKARSSRSSSCGRSFNL